MAAATRLKLLKLQGKTISVWKVLIVTTKCVDRCDDSRCQTSQYIHGIDRQIHQDVATDVFDWPRRPVAECVDLDPSDIHS